MRMLLSVTHINVMASSFSYIVLGSNNGSHPDTVVWA